MRAIELYISGNLVAPDYDVNSLVDKMNLKSMKDRSTRNDKEEVNTQNGYPASVNNNSSLDDVIFLLSK